MTHQAGLWIDHRQAVIVNIEPKHHNTLTIHSDAERHVTQPASVTADQATDTHPGAAEDTRDRHYEGQLHKYYAEVIDCLHDAEKILIVGPGEAKTELKARLEHAGHGARILGVEAADKMSEREVVAFMRERLKE